MGEILRVLVNGEPREVAAGASVADLLRALDSKPALAAVERNRELVPKARHAATRLEDGDRIEIVTFVGGG